jgi:hypothetical protein
LTAPYRPHLRPSDTWLPEIAKFVSKVAPTLASYSATPLPNNKSYTEAKQERHVLDYDDLLLYWFHLLGDETLVALLKNGSIPFTRSTVY